MQQYKATFQGFTLIELVVTLVILSIISLVVMGWFISGNAFNEIIVRDQISSLARTLTGGQGEDSCVIISGTNTISNATQTNGAYRILLSD